MKLHQQGNEIIVTELRPMSELVLRERVLLKRKDWNTLGEGYIDICGGVWIMERTTRLATSDFEGWLPMPQYRPYASSHDKAALYEKLRRMSPGEFARLAEEKVLEGKDFDELVAA